MNVRQYFKTRIKIFKNASFFLYALNCLFAPLGNGLIYIALAWSTQSTGPSVSKMALLMFALWGPSMFLAPIVGFIVDRFSPKILASLSNYLRGLAMLCLGFCFKENYASFEILFFFSFLIGIFNSFYQPAAIVLVRKIVDKKMLLYANTTSDVIIEIASVVGMGVAGILLSFIGTKLTIIIGAILFIVAGLCFFPMTLTTCEEKNCTTPDISIFSIFHYLRKNPGLTPLYISQSLLFVVMMTIPILLVPYVKEYLILKVTDFSQIEALFSIGAVFGGLLIPFLIHRISEERVLCSLWIVLAALFVVLANIHSNFLTKSTYAFVGFALSSWAVVLTKAQQLTDIHYQGRLLSLANGLAGAKIIFFYLLSILFKSSITVLTLHYLEAFLLIGSLASYLISLTILKIDPLNAQ